jgi:hypothetical protein
MLFRSLMPSSRVAMPAGDCHLLFGTQLVEPTIIDYSTADTPRRPLRAWLPVLLICVAALVWHWPRLTPTFFPNLLDKTMLGLLGLGSVLIGYRSSLPAPAVFGFGALGVCLFLLANLNDNNFRANYCWSDLLLPWSLMILGGAVAARLGAILGRAVAK